MSAGRQSKTGLSHALTIAGGSAAGQVAIVAAMPIIARLYSPDQMGVFALFTAIVGLVGPVAALHYELAIPAPKNPLHARLVTKVALLTVLSVCVLFTIVLQLFDEQLFAILKIRELDEVSGWVPVSLLAAGLMTVLFIRSIRLKTFHATALAKTLQGVGQSSAQIVLGLLKFGPTGLIYGAMIGQLVALGALFARGAWRDLSSGWFAHRSKLIVVAQRYRRFPLYSAPSSLINAAAAQLPVLTLAVWFDGRVVGLYALGFRVLQAPLRFVGDAFSQVFFGMASSGARSAQLAQVTAKSWRVPMTLALFTMAPLAIAAPEIFAVAFGSQWREAGSYTQWLAPWLMAAFVSTSMSSLVSVLQRQKQELLFQCVYLVIVLGSLYAGGSVGDERLALLLLGSAGAVLLFAKIAWLLHVAGVDLAHEVRWLLREAVRAACLAGLVWAVKHSAGSDLVVVAATGIFVLMAHGMNHFWRRTYAF